MMKNLSQKSKLSAAFFCGVLSVIFLQVTPLKASTSGLTGSCLFMGNYSTWGVTGGTNRNKIINEITYLNFDSKTYTGLFTNAVQQNGKDPVYSIVGPDNGKFELSQGPIPGTLKLIPDNFPADQYVLVAPTNSGSTILVMDPVSGMNGVCQKT